VGSRSGYHAHNCVQECRLSSPLREDVAHNLFLFDIEDFHRSGVISCESIREIGAQEGAFGVYFGTKSRTTATGALEGPEYDGGDHFAKDDSDTSSLPGGGGGGGEPRIV